MDAVASAQLRRQWPALTAIAVLAAFALVHTLLFRPIADRYHRALAGAGALGAAFDPSRLVPAVPPRVASLLAANSLAPADADAQSQSGALATAFMQQLAETADRHGLDVVVSEPGGSTQTPNGIEVRAHLRMRGSYARFAEMVDDLARDGSLDRIERFAVTPSGASSQDVEVWIARLWLRRTRATP